MFSKRLTLVSGAALTAALSALALSASGSSAAEYAAATPLLAYDLSATGPSASITPAVAAPAPGETLADVGTPGTMIAIDAASVECMAKVVMHEAANQPREGKVAVAQTLVNRLKAGRFGDSICAVANQKGQFFHIASFRPRRDSNGWQEAVEVAHDVLAGNADPVAPGAMYFRASYARTNAFFRTRERVAAVGAHVFYR